VLREKMSELMKMIKSHQQWDWTHDAPRGGNRHAQEISDFWRAYANCQAIYLAECEEEEKLCNAPGKDCPKVAVPTEVKAGAATAVATYVIWKAVKVCACGVAGGPVGAVACGVTP
jgi:hypothetical protein